MVTTVLRTPVLVVGAGVAGSVLALELAHHGVPSMVVERASRPPRHPELNLVTGRGMELLRRLGLAARIRSAGVDQDRATAVAWSRSFGEPPLLITPVPSSNEMRRRHATSTDGSQPVEPYLMLTGTGLATRLRDAVRAHPLIDLREGWTFTDLRLEPDGTVATVLDGGARTRHTVEAGYLAGCDGAQSTVRRCLGVPLEEAATPAHHCTVYFRSDGLGVGDAQPSTIIADGITLTRRAGSDLWIGHLPLEPEDAPVTDPVALLHRRLGLAVEASQIIGITQWHDALGIARTYRRGTSYLVGQSAHRFHPPSDTVDTCLGDAVDLGWKLAAAVHRWGGPELLSSYEGERRQRALHDRDRLSRALEARRRIGDLATQGASGDDLADALRDAPPQIDPAGTAVGTEYTSS
ncbi:MAG: FAD-dependent monooxygenase, partial [Actinoplanes sp.]